MAKRIVPIGRPAPAAPDAEAAQALPIFVWHLHADDRNTGQIYRPAMVIGLSQTEDGCLDLMVFRTERLDGGTGIEEVLNVPYVPSAHLEDWGPGRRYCTSKLLPPRQAPQEEPVRRPAPPAREDRPQRPRPPTAPQGASEEPDDIDAILAGSTTRRR